MATFDGSDDLDAEQTPALDRIDKEYKIFVDNLPEELDEVAIKEVFNPYGKITGMFYRPNAKWAYIMYGTYREAELAIRELNNKKPLYLKVALAKERSAVKEEIRRLGPVKIEEKSESDIVEPIVVHSVKPILQSIGRGYPIRKCFATQNTIVSPKYIQDYESTQSFSSLPTISSGYENDDPYTNTNRLWTRGILTVTADGKRHVSLGRGYTLYYPEPILEEQRREEYIKKVCELRNNGLYEYGIDKLKDGLQRCVVCNDNTTKHCEKCLTYYCSKGCQITHWPVHQAHCERIPELVEETPPAKTSKDEGANSMQKPIRTRINSNEIKLRRPNTPVQIQNLNTNVQRTNSTNKTRENALATNKCPIDQLKNDNNVPEEKKVDQSVINATYNITSQSGLHRYNGNKNGDQSKNGKLSTLLKHVHPNYNNRGYNDDATSETSSDKEINNNSKDTSNNVDKHQSHQKDGFQNDRKPPYNHRVTANKQGVSVSIVTTNKDLDFRKDTYLSKTNFKDVEIIVLLDNNEYWVYKVEDTNARKDLMMKLQEVAKNSPNVIQPMIGDVYGVLYETIWHRAMITSLYPVRVHFIDSGKDEMLEKCSEIRDIQDLAKVPRFVRKIRVQAMNAKGKNLLHGDIISVKMLSMDAEKTILVEVEEQSANLAACTIKDSSQSRSNMNNAVAKAPQGSPKLSSLNTEQTPTIQLLSIIDAFFNLLDEVSELKISGVIQISECMGKNVYSGTIAPDGFDDNMNKITNDLPMECEKMKETAANYKPQVGDLVCTEIENYAWCRGYVTTLSPELRVAVIDEARILPVSKVFPYPKEFQDVWHYGIICEVTNAELQNNDLYDFKGIIKKDHRNQDGFKVEIKKNSETIEAVIKRWQPIPKSSASKPVPAFAEIRNGSKVCLTNYRSQFNMFAQSLDEAELEYTNNLMQRVAQCAQTAPRISKPLSEQMVIAPYFDGNNYRAMITKLNGNTATIVYVDYGNFEDINVDDLREIPDDLAIKRSCSSRLTLKDVPRNVPMNADVDAYLRDLIGREEPLLCTYEDGSFKDGVYLATSSGENVNEKIKQLLVPRWKQDNYDDKTCYMIHDMAFAPLGKVGDTIEALMLHKEDDIYMMAPSDHDLVRHITEVLPKLLQEYSEQQEYYIPRNEELCVALYQGDWYRGVCFNPKLSQNTCRILFIDYGNMESVEHKDVRMMPETYIRPAAMANMCKIVNLAPVDDTGKYSAAVEKKLSELIQMNTFVKIKIVECTESGEYKIELPEVRAALIQQGLVQSSF